MFIYLLAWCMLYHMYCVIFYKEVSVMKEIVLKVEDLCKTICGNIIVKDVSFTISRGEILGIIGPNGAGKTTLMKMIVQLKKQTKGKIEILGNDVNKNYEEAISKVGIVIENPAFYNYMTGYENLLCYYKVYKKFDKNRIDEVVNIVGLKEKINYKVNTYSLGMKQRLGLAQAILHKPDILILDEPTNGLDPMGIKQLREYLIQIAKNENVAILLSSHILSEIQSICDNVIFLNKQSITKKINLKDIHKNNIFSFEVGRKKDLVKLLQDNNFNFKFSVNGCYLNVETEKEYIPLVNSKLVELNIPVYGIKCFTNSIEDKFFEFLKGDESNGFNSDRIT